MKIYFFLSNIANIAKLFFFSKIFKTLNIYIYILYKSISKYENMNIDGILELMLFDIQFEIIA